MHSRDADPPDSLSIPVLGGTVHAAEKGDVAVAAVAGAQQGLISREQLQAAGLGRGAIAHRTANGRLHRVRRGVYLVGHPAPPPMVQEIAALLAAGPRSVLSHRSAAVLWRLAPHSSRSVDVTVVGRDCGRRPGVRDHRVGELASTDLRHVDGIPVTSPARSLLDLAGEVSDGELARAVDEAVVQKLTSMDDLRALLGRSKGRRGTPALRNLLDDAREPALTRSEAEREMLALLRRGGLAQPVTNVKVGSYEVDMLWRRERLVVEVDGYAFHSTRAAFERDRARDADLQTRGLRVLRVTWTQIRDEPEAVLVRIARLLG
jgi:very-short-patch-repair endonuclease